MPDLLLEVLSEEIPARMQGDGADELEKQVCSRLEEARLAHQDVQTFATPRRLALIVRGLSAVQPDITVERKGPRVDAPEKAIQGFLKSTGLTLDDCEQRETPKGLVWFAVKQEKGRPTADLLAELLPQALAAVSWPKSMRWEETGMRWVRPIRSILCLLDDQVVPFRLGTVESGRTTLGHPFLSSGPLTIKHVGDYVVTLESAKVMPDREKRRQKIVDDIWERVTRARLNVALDDLLVAEFDLVTENTGLVEWPKVMMGSIDPDFMDLPPEVLRSAMGKHQRYFGVSDGEGRPAPHFVMVANAETIDGNNSIVAGNERVLRARLADARFFWEQDQRKRLEAYLPALDGVIFHARLGSMKDKAERIEKLTRLLCPAIPGADRKQAARAGLLCKADLVTEMVGEFPDLQGIMGRYYAREDDEPEAVYEAIGEHYALYPKQPVSVAVAIADKLDTLAGFFAIDERPTGSKDPFALRRAALGVIRLIMNWRPKRGRVIGRVHLSLASALTSALAGYDTLLPAQPGPEATRDALLVFFAERVKVYLREQGVPHDHINAVLAVDGVNNLVLLEYRIDALKYFLDSDDGANLLTAYRRAANILRIEEKKDGEQYTGQADPELFHQGEESALHERIGKAGKRAQDALEREGFQDAMSAMATLREPVDAFFDNVTVNCGDPALRRNRLLMLSQIRSTLDRVADFSKIEG